MNAHNSPIIDLGNWLEQPAGSYIRAWEQAKLDQLTVDIFGFHALQIGLPQIDALRANRMPHQWQSDCYLRNKNPAEKVAVVHDFAELPFDAQSMDLVVLPHVLEFANEPHQILREVERILIPEGRVIVCGFNRRSLWGARHFGARMIGHSYMPREGEFISSTRMKDWLKLLNMEIEKVEFGCYGFPFKTQQWLERFQFMENLGQQWWPYLGAIYMVQAVKRVKGMHLIGPVRKRKSILSVSPVAVSNRAKKVTHSKHLSHSNHSNYNEKINIQNYAED